MRPPAPSLSDSALKSRGAVGDVGRYGLGDPRLGDRQRKRDRPRRLDRVGTPSVVGNADLVLRCRTQDKWALGCRLVSAWERLRHLVLLLLRHSGVPCLVRFGLSVGMARLVVAFGFAFSANFRPVPPQLGRVRSRLPPR